MSDEYERSSEIARKLAQEGRLDEVLMRSDTPHPAEAVVREVLAILENHNCDDYMYRSTHEQIEQAVELLRSATPTTEDKP